MSNYAIEIAAKKANWTNACAMAFHSFELELGTIVPMNFTNGRNASPRHQQDADLLLVASVEGYKTPYWATPRQIKEAGGVIKASATYVPIFVDKKSRRTGKEYTSSYNVVSLDCVEWPNGVPDDVLLNVAQLASNPIEAAVVEYDAPTPIPPRAAVETNEPTKQENEEVASANLAIDFDGIHVEGPSIDVLKQLLDMAVQARIALK